MRVHPRVAAWPPRGVTPCPLPPACAVTATSRAGSISQVRGIGSFMREKVRKPDAGSRVRQQRLCVNPVTDSDRPNGWRCWRTAVPAAARSPAQNIWNLEFTSGVPAAADTRGPVLWATCCRVSPSIPDTKPGAEGVAGLVILTQGLTVTGEVLQLDGGVEMGTIRQAEPQIEQQTGMTSLVADA